tara:strand:- start:328 stop:495 length:168 start_codon:yes stop_codon:yes gene_type:complete
MGASSVTVVSVTTGSGGATTTGSGAGAAGVAATVSLGARLARDLADVDFFDAGIL